MVTTRRGFELPAALGVGWLGVNAAWGLTGLDGTVVSDWMVSWAPLGAWLAVTFVVLAALWTLARRGTRENAKAVAFAILLVATYVAGVFAFDALHTAFRSTLGSTGVPARALFDGVRFAAHRSFILMPLIPMLLVWRVASPVQGSPLPFRGGDWTTRTHLKLPFVGQLSWVGGFALFALAVALPVFLYFQFQVDFAPVTTGVLFRLAPALVLMALANGTIEELIFRGVFLSSLVPATGARAAVWLQAIFFGLHHYGSSPVPMANLATTLGATAVGYMWGRSVVGTRGIGWAVGTHMLADLTFFSVTHVSW